jgi:hypothetical protein
MPTTIFNIALTGNDDVDAQLKALGDAGEAAVARIKAAAESAGTAAGGGIAAMKNAGEDIKTAAGAAGSAITQQMATIERALSGGVMSSLQNLSGQSGLGGLLNVLKNINPEVAGFVAAVGALFTAGVKAGEATHELSNQAAALGVSVQKMQGLAFAAGQAGLGVDEFTKYVAKSEQVLGEYAKTQQTQADAAVRAGEEATKASDEHQLAIQRNSQAIDDYSRKMADLRDSAASARTGIQSAALAVDKSRESLRQLGVMTTGMLSTNKDYLKDQAKLSEGAQQQAIDSAKLVEANSKVAANTRAQASETEHLATAQAEFNTKMKDTVSAAVPATKAVDDLIKASGAMNLTDPVERLEALVGELNKIKDPAVLATEAAKLFGRGWRDMAELIKDGPKEFQANIDAFAKTGLALSDAEKDMGSAFDQSYQKLKAYTEALSLSVGNIVGQVFRPLMDGISDWLAENNDLVKQVVTGFTDVMVPAVKGFGVTFGGMVTIVTEGCRLILDALGPVASAVNFVFGTKANGAAVAYGATLGTISLAFLGISKGMDAVSQGWTKFTSDFKGQFDALGKAWQDVCGVISRAWNDTASGFTSSGDVILDVINDVIKAARYLYDQIEIVLRGIDKMTGSKLAAGSGAAASGSPAGADGSRLMASGGHVSGPGGGDVIPALLTRNEYVVRSQAVNHYGVGFFHMLNSLRALPGMALGGIVGALSSSLSPPMRAGAVPTAGAMGASGHPVYLTIGTETFHMTAAADVAEKMTSFAQTRRLRSAGTKPSWYD